MEVLVRKVATHLCEDYSCLSAAMGSTRKARRAGKQLAIKPAESNISEAPRMEGMSFGDTP
jgi:hypothetical protein